jgi:hypothetical protein
VDGVADGRTRSEREQTKNNDPGSYLQEHVVPAGLLMVCGWRSG